MKRILATLLIPFLVWACIPLSGPIDNEKPEEIDSDVEQVDPSEPLPPVVETYKEISGAVLNPERGYYYPVDFTSGSSALKASAVKAQRLEGRTLFYLGFYLTDFMKGDISKTYLDKIQSSLDAIREGGAKCILRFAYKSSESNKPWDPSVDIVLRHVEQLKPILQKNEDVIFVLQAGFVGVWGEWYYTQNFIMNPSSDADYQPRRKLTDALLDALPASRQIQLRTPQFKMRMFGLTVKDTLTAKTAHNGTPVSRLAGHNDCFGAAADDWGTFDNEARDRDFWKADTRYTIMGGETCNVSDYCTCTASLKDMEDYHWTFLNSGYHGDVISRWKKQGCGDEINLRLGYRLVLKESYRSENPVAGEEFSLALKIENKGFAAPQNPRNAILVFVAEDGTKSEFRMGADPRTWHPGESIVRCRFALPAEKGTLYLNLSDPLLPDRPEYSIALANEGVFDSKTGYNKLFTL